VEQAVTMGDPLYDFRAVPERSKAPTRTEGGMTYWATQVAWGSSRALATLPDTRSAAGFTGGAENNKLGRFGASLSYLWGEDNDATDNNGGQPVFDRRTLAVAEGGFGRRSRPRHRILKAPATSVRKPASD
jgi:hypothetical protein